jgi:putative redox protein
MNIEVDGINLLAELYLPTNNKNSAFPSLCICHGIPSGKPPDQNDKGYPLLAEHFCSEGIATIIFNFRGTGFSEGNLDMLGWTRDLEEVIDYMYQCVEIKKDSLSLMGFSGGAAIATYVSARNDRVASVVLCACPSEFGFAYKAETADSWVEHFREIGVIRDEDFPPSVSEWLKGFEIIRPINWIKKISPRPLLIVHGDQDSVVEPTHAWTLFEEAGQPKEIAIVRGGDHKLRLNREAIGIVLKWLKRQSN